MTPQQRRERGLAEIRAAGTALARKAPPLTERQIERLAFLIAPTVASAPRQATALQQAA